MAADANEARNPTDFGSLMEGIKTGEVKLSDQPSNQESSEEPSAEEAPSTNVVDDWNQFKKGEADEKQPEEESSDEPSLMEAKLDADEESEAKDSKSSSAIEEVMISDAKGRRKVKVDFSDRDKLRKYVQFAAGARKWQAERDEARSELSSISEEYKSLQGDWNRLEEAYSAGGVAGLVDLLEGQSGSYDNFLAQEIERRNAYQQMSDSERAEVDRQRAAETQERKNQELQNKYEEMLKKMESDKEAAEMRSLESKLHPSFDRYRFAGKLGDEVAETEFDEMLWNRSLSLLEKIPQEVEITQAVIDKEFRKVANSMRKHMNAQVENKVKRAITKTKESATKKAQAKVGKSLRQSAEVEEFKKNMRTGNLVDGLSSFFKAGGKL